MQSANSVEKVNNVLKVFAVSNQKVKMFSFLPLASFGVYRETFREAKTLFCVMFYSDLA